MGKPITGSVTFPKEFATEDFWHSEPFDRPRALLDLWLLANDRRRTITIRGQAVTLDRGQLAWSVVQLSERWRWSRPKTTAFLTAMQDERRVMLKTTNLTTIITVMDYTVYNNDSTPENAPALTAEVAPALTAEMTANFTQKIEDRKGEVQKIEGGMENSPFPEIEVPSFEAFRAACEIRGIPAWWLEDDYAWRSQSPADRWPKGANWMTAVTHCFTRWRAAGAPMLPRGVNGVGKKTAGAWEIKQRLDALRAQAQNHPANEASSAWVGEPTEDEGVEYDQLREKIAAAEKELAQTA